MSYISPQPEQSSPEEIELLTELNDLPNSSDNEFLKKVGGSIINSPIGSHINIGELGDVRITDVNSNDFLQYDSDNAVWINRNSIILNGFTQGSILFAGAGGVITQDNANAFWDNVNKRMGIGTNSPVESLDISGAIKVGTTANTNVGAIRYDGSNFQGYNGSWVDLDTQGGGSSGVIGSVQFSDGAGGFSSDNSNFFWDDSNNRLGIGTNSLVANTQLTLRGQTNGGAGNILLGQDSLGATKFTLTDQGKLTLPVGVNAGLYFGDGDTFIYESADDVLDFQIKGGLRWRMEQTMFSSGGGKGGWIRILSPGSTIVTMGPHTQDLNTGLGHAGDDQLSLIAGGVEGIRITEATSISINMGLADSDKTYWGAGSDAYIEYDGTDMNIVTDAVGASDLVIDCGTEKTIELAETVWDDYVTPLGANNWRGSSNNPVLTKMADDGSGSQGVYAFVFSDGDEALITVQMPHRWKEGTTLKPHIHFKTMTDVDPADNFGIEFEWWWADIGEAFPANTTLETNYISTGVNSSSTHQIADVTTAGIDGTGHTISSVLLCRIKRVSATSDNYSGGVAIMDFDVHYEIDTMGSRQELVK